MIINLDGILKYGAHSFEYSLMDICMIQLKNSPKTKMPSQVQSKKAQLLQNDSFKLYEQNIWPKELVNKKLHNTNIQSWNIPWVLTTPLKSLSQGPGVVSKINGFYHNLHCKWK